MAGCGSFGCRRVGSGSSSDRNNSSVTRDSPRQVGVPIEPHEFFVPGQVSHRRIVRRVIPRHEGPAHMGVEKATLHRRMHIRRRIRVSVMQAVLGCPLTPR